MSTLMAVILSLVGIDLTTGYNCEVHCVHCLYHVHPRSDKSHVLGRDHLPIRECAPPLPRCVQSEE